MSATMSRSRRCWPALPALILALCGCRTSPADIERWGTTENGPDKLTAVMEHAKYDVDLRVRASLTLIGMKPRGGRRIGIDRLLTTLERMPKKLRDEALPVLTDGVIDRMQGGAAPGSIDETVAFKDVAYALLEHHGKGFVSDAAQRGKLEAALTAWAMQDFLVRLDAPGQRIGMHQMLADLGPASVRGLPELIRPEVQKNDEIVRIVSEVADDETKLRAAAQLVRVARHAASAGWRAERSEQLRKQDPDAFERAGSEAIQKHLLQQQDDEVLRVFASTKRLGQPQTLEFLVDFAGDAQYPEKQRLGSLAALEGHIESASDAVIDELYAFATDEKTPQSLRASAFVRLGEASLARMLPRLRSAIREGGFGVRLAAAEVLLGRLKADGLPDFFETLAELEHMSVGEPLRYGRLLGKLEGFDSRVVDSYIAKRNTPVPVRLTALGYYYAYGTNDQLGELERARDDEEQVPRCPEEESECSWSCAGEDIESVGDFVRHCVEPHMANRTGSELGTKAAQAGGNGKNPQGDTPKASQETDKAE